MGRGKRVASEILHHTPARLSKWSAVMEIVCTLDIMWWKGHISSMTFLLPQMCNTSLTMRKTSETLQLRNILQHIWPVLLRIVKVTKVSKVVDKFQRQEEPKKTWLLCLLLLDILLFNTVSWIRFQNRKRHKVKN